MKLLSRTNAIGVLAGAIVLVGNWLGWYRSWWWFDNALHFLGGVALGGLISSRESSLRLDLGLVLLLGVAWELIEYHEGVYPWDGSVPPRAAAEDTILDMMLVAGGAYAVASAD